MRSTYPLTMMLLLANCGTQQAPAGGVVASDPATSPGASPSMSQGSGTTTPTPVGGANSNDTTAGTVFFSPYKDITISANWNTGAISTAVTGTLTPVTQAVPEVPAMTWAFATGECGTENWGGIPNAQVANNVIPWVAAKKSYVLSTGGANGSFTCATDAGFSAFIDRYASAYLVGVDFDIEAGQTADGIAALMQRIQTAQANPKYANLRFSFTIATLGGNANQSLGPQGVLVMNALKTANLKNYTVNLMTMDYGAPTAANCTLDANMLCNMGASAAQAAKNLQEAYGIPFTHIELTPMIGGNDTQNETFTLDDIATVSNFAKQNNLAGVHVWSLDRDTDCTQTYASPTCNSYGKAGILGFVHAFLKAL